MFLPTNISTGRVTGQFFAGVVDGADDDQDPDGRPAAGFVTFTASVPYLPDPTASPNPATILMTSVVAVLDSEGYICTPVEGTLEPSYRGVRLIATDDTDLSVSGWTWNVTYTFTAASGQKLTIPTHSFALPAEGVVDLTTVVRVPSSTGIGTEQAEALAASAQAAAVRAAEDAAAAAQAAVDAAGAAQVTDGNISALVGNPATDTAEAVSALVEAAAADKLNIDDAIDTYQSRAALDAAIAAKVATGGTSSKAAVQTIADASAAAAAEPKLDSTTAATTYAAKSVETSKLDASALDASTAALVNNPDSSWWVALLTWLKTIFVGKREIIVNVTEFGAIGDYIDANNKGTDNLAAFNAAFAYAASITKYAVKLFIPAGRYRFSGQWNTYRSSASTNTLVVEGADQLSTFLISDFYGAEKGLVKCADPAGVSRVASTNVRQLQFGSVDRNGPNPVFLDIAGWGESRAECLRFGSSNNTVFRASSLQNVRMRDIVSFYGGRHYNYKATDGLTFSTTTGGIVTASAPIFAAGDVGKTFSIYPPNVDTRVKYTISQVNSTTEAVVTGLTLLATTGAKGFFEAAQGAITAGSTTFDAESPVFTATDVGRVIYIRGARAGAWGEGNLRATIAGYTSPTRVTLDTAAGLTVTRAPFTTPVMDFYSAPGTGVFSADSNDVKIDLLHIENYAGVGLCTTPNVFFHIDKMKIHGEVDPIDARHSTAAMWLDDYAGTINGEFDGMSTGDSRVHVSSLNDLVTIEWLSTKRIRGEITFKSGVMTDPKGFVEVKTFNCYQTTVSGNPYDLIVDPNAQPRIVFTGVVNMLGDALPPRIYLAKDTYITPQGVLVRGNSTTTTGFDAIWAGQNGARMLFEDIATRKYSLGNTAGGGTSFTITDETANLVRLLIGSTGNIVPGANDTQSFGALATRWAMMYATQYSMGSTGI